MPKTATQTKKKKDYRTFLTLHETGDKLETYAGTDPRFTTRSECARHLIELGLKADKKAREKALAGVNV